MTLSKSGRDPVASHTRPQTRPIPQVKALSYRQHGAVDSADTVGQFSFGPATQTTVVTTTTTTTTRFPPFVMKASKRATQLDTKAYPLARIPTPAALKRIVFAHDGRQVIFHEAPDTSLALEELYEEQETLRKGKGVVQHIHQSDSYFLENAPEPLRSTSKMNSEGPASPQSINEEEEEEEKLDGTPAAALRIHSTGKNVLNLEHQLHSNPRLRDLHTFHPITPDTQSRPSMLLRRRSHRASPNRIQPVLPSPDTEEQIPAGIGRDDALSHEVSLDGRTGHSSRTISSRDSAETVVPTPPIEPDENRSQARSLSGRALSSIPSRLHVADSPSTQDGNLPSPSLSPVTAAAHARNVGYFNDLDARTDRASRQTTATITDELDYDGTASSGRYGSPAATENDEHEQTWPDRSGFSESSLADIPAMLDMFEALPDELKSYVIHQLLRRCPKSTLHVVAEAVNPALKCDFLDVLPPELGLNILSYLDVKSLCKAAQVSRKWRQMINSDEKAWKELFDADGYSLPAGELQQAITQGWGWQDPYGTEGCEQDLSVHDSVSAESDAGSPTPAGLPRYLHTSNLRRSKRKAQTLLSNRNKQLKRHDRSRESSVDLESIDWMSHMSTAEGPYNAANAAIMAVPDPKLPVPGLKGLHLYKTLMR